MPGQGEHDCCYIAAWWAYVRGRAKLAKVHKNTLLVPSSATVNTLTPKCASHPTRRAMLLQWTAYAMRHICARIHTLTHKHTPRHAQQANHNQALVQTTTWHLLLLAPRRQHHLDGVPLVVPDHARDVASGGPPLPGRQLEVAPPLGQNTHANTHTDKYVYSTICTRSGLKIFMRGTALHDMAPQVRLHTLTTLHHKRA